MSENIFAVGQMSSLLIEVGTLLQNKINREIFDVSTLLKEKGNSHMPVGVRIF